MWWLLKFFSNVVFQAEQDIIRAARLRKFLKIEQPYTQTLESALCFRDKIIMKERLQTKNINVPKFKRIESTDDIFFFIKENGFPVVIKPTRYPKC